MLTSWIVLVFMTGEEVGCPAGSRPEADAAAGRGAEPLDDSSSRQDDSGQSRSSGGSSSSGVGSSGGSSGGRSSGGDATSLGMRRFVKQAVVQFAGGTRLADLMELQVSPMHSCNVYKGVVCQ